MDNFEKMVALLNSSSFGSNSISVPLAKDLVAGGAIVVPKRASEVFHFKKGCLPRKEWGEVIGACKVIGEAVWDAPSGGFTDNGVDYVPVDLMREPEEVEEALCTVIAFFRQVYGFDVYEKMAAFDEAAGFEGKPEG